MDAFRRNGWAPVHILALHVGPMTIIFYGLTYARVMNIITILKLMMHTLFNQMFKMAEFHECIVAKNP